MCIDSTTRGFFLEVGEDRNSAASDDIMPFGVSFAPINFRSSHLGCHDTGPMQKLGRHCQYDMLNTLYLRYVRSQVVDRDHKKLAVFDLQAGRCLYKKLCHGAISVAAFWKWGSNLSRAGGSLAATHYHRLRDYEGWGQSCGLAAKLALHPRLTSDFIPDGMTASHTQYLLQRIIKTTWTLQRCARKIIGCPFTKNAVYWLGVVALSLFEFARQRSRPWGCLC